MLRDYRSEARWPGSPGNLYGGQRDWSRLLSRAFAGGLQYGLQVEFPPVNVWASQDGAIVMAELPGVSADQLDISVHQNTVTLRGKREPEALGDEARVIRRERIYGSFSRAVVLPFRVDAERISANLERGVLRLELPRPEDDKPRHIKIAH
jgi:HSP20 family protein